MESLDTLNQRLIDEYGLESSVNQPMFRIVWANDQTEKRLVYHSEAGIQYLFPMVQECKKYSYLKDLYVLERLVVVPDVNKIDLPTTKLSYEPLWSYRDAAGNALPPVWPPTKFIIDSLYAALGKKSMAKYVEDERNTTAEGREARIKELQDDLFGNETDVGDALAYKDGIVVPQSYKSGE